jgi:hypothetical protein
MEMRVVFDHEADELANVSFWPGGFRSAGDGCWHVLVSDREISGPNDSYELIIIPRHECRVMYE